MRAVNTACWLLNRTREERENREKKLSYQIRENWKGKILWSVKILSVFSSRRTITDGPFVSKVRKSHLMKKNSFQ